jgi:hypothetical protein
MEVIERLYTEKMRVWDVYLDDIHLGIVGFNTESENIHFKLRPEFKKELAIHMVRAKKIVKSQLVDEVLLEDA